MAFTTLQEAIEALQAAAGAVEGVKFAPDYPPEQMSDFPFVVTYPVNVKLHQGPTEMITYLYDIRIELHITRVWLENDIYTALPYAESIPNAIYTCLNDNATAQGDVNGSFGALGWGEGDTAVPTIGFQWTFSQVKIQKVLS